MKIRIKGNSIRLRLSKSEVDLFASQGFVREKTEFENGTFFYMVKNTTAENLSADFINGDVTLFVPEPPGKEMDDNKSCRSRAQYAAYKW